jgi:UDP-2,4-diacetamido-2,4,6-trideoxy-beta-L-altropyranose hydrolase
MNEIYLRADGSSTIGLGHIYRLITIGQYLQDKFKIIFILNSFSEDFLVKIINSVGFDYIKLPTFDSIIDEANFIAVNIIGKRSLIVLDGYQFNSMYEITLKQNGSKVVLIDDIGDREIAADVILNHSPGALEIQYKLVNPDSKLYLGPEFAILREPFLKEAHKNIELPQLYSTIFISMGGADPHNLTAFFLQAMLKNEDVRHINILLGGANRNDYSAFLSNVKITFFNNLMPDKIIQLVKESDLAICPASTISMELIAIGIPIMAGYSENNQMNIYLGLQKNSCVIPMGNLLLLDEKQISLHFYENRKVETILDLLKKQKRLVDGDSDKRIYKIFNDLYPC